MAGKKDSENFEEKYGSMARIDPAKMDALKAVSKQLGVSSTFLLDAVLAAALGTNEGEYAQRLLQVAPNGFQILVQQLQPVSPEGVTP